MDRFDRQLELADGIETEYLRILYYTFEKNYNDTYKSYEYKRLCTIVDGEKNVRINNGRISYMIHLNICFFHQIQVWK